MGKSTVDSSPSTVANQRFSTVDCRLLTVDSYSSYPLDPSLPKESLRAHEQEERGQHVREPVLDAAADMGAQIDLGELLGGSHDEPSDDRSRDRGEAAQNQDRQGLQRDEGQGELHAG